MQFLSMAYLLIGFFFWVITNASHTYAKHWRELLASDSFNAPVEPILRRMCKLSEERLSIFNQTNGLKNSLRLGELFPCGSERNQRRNKEDDPKVTLLSHTEFDGLGHFGYRVAREYRRLIRVRQTLQNDYSFFKEDFTMSTIHLKNVALGPGGNNVSSILCHQKSFGSFNNENRTVAYSTYQAEFFSRYECHLIPDLDEWFNFVALKTRRNPSGEEDVSLAYAAVRRDKLISCGAKAKITSTGKSIVQVAIHLRLGDLVPDNDMQSDWSQKKIDHIMQRYNSTLRQYYKLFQFFFNLEDYMNSKQGGWRILDLLVVSDSSFQTIAKVLKSVGIEIVSKDGVAHYRLTGLKMTAADMAKERVDDSLKIQRTRQMKIRFLGDSNPLVAFHCLTDADILVKDSISFFSKFAGTLRSQLPNWATFDMNSIPSLDTFAHP